MRNIIADCPAMQELYDAYNKPKFVTHTTMQFQEFRVKRMIPVHMKNFDEFIERAKPAFERALLEEIKECITYDVDTEGLTPIIIASIFVGRKQ